MSSGLQRWYDEEEERYCRSPEGQASEKRIIEWNKLINEIPETPLAKLLLQDLTFLLEVKKLYHPSNRLEEDRLERLKNILRKVHA